MGPVARASQGQEGTTPSVRTTNFQLYLPCPYEARGTGLIRTSGGSGKFTLRTRGDAPECPCASRGTGRIRTSSGRVLGGVIGATTTGDVPGRPCCQLTATLGLSVDGPASKEEPVRATRTGRQLVAHFATLLFTLSLQGMRMEQARTRADVAGDRGLSPVRS